MDNSYVARAQLGLNDFIRTLDLQNTFSKLPPISRLPRRIWYLIGCGLLIILTFLWSSGEQHETIKSLPGLKGYLKDESTTILELEGITIGEPFTIDEKRPRIDQLVPLLQQRFIAGDAYPAYPNCSLNIDRYRGIAGSDVSRIWSKGENVVSFAINIHKSEDIIPAQAVALLEAAAHLMSKGRNKVYISLFDSDSHDRTGPYLSDFVAAAKQLGVHGIWVTSSRMRNGDNTDRIAMLSEIRNHAIAPLLPYASPRGKGAHTLVFLNDIVTCPSDILELVHQQRLQKGDMVMGMDWNPWGESVRLYDLWVARGINGGLAYTFSENYGLSAISQNDDWVRDLLSTQSRTNYQRWLDGRPLPVYCMWGGMVAFDATLFTKNHLRFRSSIKSGWKGGAKTGALGDWGDMISDQYLEADCPGASECEYICRDVWNLRHGKARVFVAPQARTMYSVTDWNAKIDLVPATRRTEADTDGGDLISWDDVKMPASVECIPARSQSGELQDCWAAERYRLTPLFEWSSHATRSIGRALGLMR